MTDIDLDFENIDGELVHTSATPIEPHERLTTTGSSAREAVRSRPALYVGDRRAYGLHNLFNEVLNNAIDEHSLGYATAISVVIHPDRSISVSDNGRGLSIDPVDGETISGVEHALTEFSRRETDADCYRVAGGLRGVGLACTNFLSEWCRVEVVQKGYRYEMQFERGEKTGGLKRIGVADGHGTTITWLPDDTIFGTHKYQPNLIMNRVRKICYLNRRLKISFRDERAMDSPGAQEFQFKRGAAAMVEELNELTAGADFCPTLYVQTIREAIDVEIAVQFHRGSSSLVLSFANNHLTADGGTHVAGFYKALTEGLTTQARESKSIKDDDQEFSLFEVQKGMTAVISVRLFHPILELTTKSKLGNKEAAAVVYAVLAQALRAYLEKYPSASRRIIRKIAASRSTQV